MHLVFCFQGAQEVPDKADHQVQGALAVARLAKAADLQEVDPMVADLQEVDRSESVEAVVVKTNNVQSLIEELSVKMFLINF